MLDNTLKWVYFLKKMLYYCKGHFLKVYLIGLKHGSVIPLILINIPVSADFLFKYMVKL